MTPLGIELLLGYYARPEYTPDHPSAPAVVSAIRDFVESGLIVETVRGFYETTEKGRVYVEALCDVPMPVAVWSIPPPVARRVSFTSSTEEFIARAHANQLNGHE